MGKDPAFLFYPGDWLSGTMGMTFEEKGAYMELLMAQFSRGHMTYHMIGQVLGQNSGQIWEALKDKFKIDEQGRYFNERLEAEKERRKAFVSSRNNNISGNNQHTKNKKNTDDHMNGHMTSHMENRNINNNVIVFKNLPMFEKIKNEQFLAMCENVSHNKGKLTNLADFKNEYYRLIANKKELHQQSGRDEAWLAENAKRFIKEQAAVNKEYDNYADFFSHFLNWTRKQPK